MLRNKLLYQSFYNKLWRGLVGGGGRSWWKRWYGVVVVVVRVKVGGGDESEAAGGVKVGLSQVFHPSYFILLT